MTPDEEEAAYGGEFMFDFYEVVEVVGEGPLPLGSLVAVMARSRNADGTEWYAVTPEDGESCMLAATSLKSTGRAMRHEDFYDGESIRVSRHGELLEDE